MKLTFILEKLDLMVLINLNQ